MSTVEERTHSETLVSMQKCIQQPGTTIKEDGIKNVSCIVGLNHINIIQTFAIDYMHNCLIGNGMLLLELWTRRMKLERLFCTV